MTVDVECPRPVRPLKRALQDTFSECAPVSKHCRLESPTFLPTLTPIYDWLSKVPHPSSRPRSAPARLPSSGTLAAIYPPTSLTTVNQMSHSQGKSLRPGSNSSAQSSRPNTSSPVYRSTLVNNNIYMDHRGRKIPESVRTLVDTHILKERSSPPLAQESVLETVETAEDLADSAESKVSDLIRTPMFPVKRRDIGDGGDAIWSTDALPRNPLYQHPLSAPKPDYHYGYPAGQRSTWKYEENAVVDHRVPRPYAQPARCNRFPFLAVEIKSEATGGTLWHAENQAAGSGAHCVNSVRWLLEQAGTGGTYSTTDSIAFTIALTHRQVIVHIHHYSEEERRIYMSYLKSFSPIDPADVQGCHDIVKNILDYGLGTRQTTIRNALARLFPFPENWKHSRPASGISSTPAPSIITEDSILSKNIRRG